MKRLCVLIMFFVGALSSSAAEQNDKSGKEILIISMPKAGTHLIQKVIMLIQEQFHSHLENIDLAPNYKTEETFFTHFHFLNPKFLGMKIDECVKVLVIRDLRDVLVSQAHWIAKHGWFGYLAGPVIDAYKQFSPEEQLNFVIRYKDPVASIKAISWQANAWMQRPDTFLCRFEDYIGPQGGGDEEVQVCKIEELANYLGYPLSRKDAEIVAAKTFGDTKTFRKGQVQGWRDHFTPEHIENFKQAMGEELIFLGYEKDNNW